MRNVTLKYMRERAAWHAEIPVPTADTWISIADANSEINAGVAEMHGLMVAANGVSAYRKPFSFITDGINSVFTLPNDFGDLQDVEVKIDASRIVPLERFTTAERPLLLSTWTIWSGEPLKYSLQGKGTQDGSDPGTIELLPVPAANLPVTVWYTFAPQVLVNDGDVLDGFQGYEDYPIMFAARRFALRGEEYERSDRLGAEAQRIKDRIISRVQGRDSYRIGRVNMTRVDGYGLNGRRRGWVY